MDFYMKETIAKTWIDRGLKVIITIIISIFLYSIINKLINKNKHLEKVTDKKTTTYIKLLSSLNKYIFIAITFLVILQILEINITSVIAGVGLLGAIFGLAIQDWLKDIIRGSTILSDNYFQVGDVVKYKNVEGKVLLLGLKTTKIKDLKTQNIISIANRNIDEIEVVSNFVYLNIPLPYELTIKDSEKIVNEITKKVSELDNVEECTYKSIGELSDSSIMHLFEIKCSPLSKRQITRNAYKEALLVLEKNNISIPYNQIDVHQK